MSTTTTTTTPVNMPTIKFYKNSTPNVSITSTSTSTSISTLVKSNPLVTFDSAGLAGGLVQPPNWYYYLINNDGTSTNYITISVAAAQATGSVTGPYPLPAINFMLIGPGGLGGLGSGCGGGGGGTGEVLLVNNYLSGVNSTSHYVNLYPLAQENNVDSYNCSMYLDAGVNLNNVFYANNGGAGGNASTSRSGYGGNGGSGLNFPYPSDNALPIYNPIVIGGAGGNRGTPNGSDDPCKPGVSYAGAVIPTGSNQTYTSPPAYIPVTFADGLTNPSLFTAGVGGTPGPSSTPGVGGTAGKPGPPSMFMLYFCL